MEVENPPIEGVRKLIVENLKMSRIAMQGYINFLETMMRGCPGASEEQVGAFKAHLEKQVETNHAFVEQLLHAKDFPDALRIESEYFQSQMAEVVDRSSKIGLKMANLFKQSPPSENLSSRSVRK